MKNFVLFLAATCLFAVVGCGDDALHQDIAPTTEPLKNSSSVTVECKTLELEQVIDIDFRISPAKGSSSSGFGVPTAIVIIGSNETAPGSFANSSVTANVEFDFTTDYAGGRIIISEAGRRNTLVLQVARRPASIDKNEIQMDILGVRGFGSFRQYNVARGTVNIVITPPFEEAGEEEKGQLIINAALDCRPDDRF